MYKIIEMTDADLHWPFSGSEGPLFVLGQVYPRSTPVDPFPCYSHDRKIVEDTLQICHAMFPLGLEVYVYLLPYETTSRTNGWTQNDYSYNRNGKSSEPMPSIILPGKRIPPHPAITRYVTCHEYGHVVEKWIKYKTGKKENDESIIKEYIEIRGLEKLPDKYHYGARNWHITPGEIFANDFRMLVCNVEVEFWPHEGVGRPEENGDIVYLWQEIVKEFRHR